MSRQRNAIFNDPEALKTEIERYFEHCRNSEHTVQLKNGDVRIRKETPSMIGLAVWLDCDKSTLYRYIDGEYHSDREVDAEITKTIRDSLTRARSRMEDALLQRATDGDCDPRTAAILLATYGYTERLQVEATDVTVKVQGSTADVEGWSR